MPDGVILKLRVIGDDNLCMINFELEQLQENIECQQVLRAYQQSLKAALLENPEQGKWLPRIRTVPAVERSQLSSIHGKLIALGFLKFELVNQNAGMQYQLTAAGIRAINTLEKVEAKAA